MRDRPTAPDLLETAQAVFRDRLLPNLPADVKYDALMVLNVMGIAARQTMAGDQPEREAHARLAALYGDEAAALADQEGRLAADLRAGRFDPGSAGRDAVFDHLWKTARAKAAESAPKALRGRPE